MHEYKCVTRHIQRNFLGEAAHKVDGVIQPMLDEGVAAGWTLHSHSTAGQPDGDLTVVTIWQRAKGRLQDTIQGETPGS